MAPRRVLITLTDLDGGGAQRVVLTLLRHLPRDRFDLHLALVQRRGLFLEELPDDVSLHDLGASRVRGAALPLVRLVRRLRPEAVFSTLYHLNQMVIAVRPAFPRDTRVVIREGVTVSRALERRPQAALAAFLIRTLYPRADRIVCQCEFMADDLAQNYRVPRERMTTIYNPVDVEEVRSRARAANPFRSRGSGPHVLAMGRLDHQKGFDELIRRFPALLRDEPGAELWILGKDPAGSGYSAGLRELASSLGVEERVHLEGFVANPYPYLAHADLFVLSSRYEGLPNVLLEALACGCPVVALDRPGGTRELMELTGQRERLIPELIWQSDWLRAPEPAPPPDLSAFSIERAITAYSQLLAPP